MAEIGNSIEEWKTVPDYPNYEVSNYGHVRSKDRVVMRSGNQTKLKGHLLTPREIKGYARVTLYDGNRDAHKQFLVHRLVAIAFIPNRNNFPCINHIDENRMNNHVHNLEWCTHQYNSNYGTAIERRVKHQDWESIARKQSVAVKQIDRDGAVVRVWPSMIECERQTGMKSCSISKCCSGYLKTYKGFLWRKVET